jgi:hypothetical protein
LTRVVATPDVGEAMLQVGEAAKGRLTVTPVGGEATTEPGETTPALGEPTPALGAPMPALGEATPRAGEATPPGVVASS